MFFLTQEELHWTEARWRQQSRYCNISQTCYSTTIDLNMNLLFLYNKAPRHHSGLCLQRKNLYNLERTKQLVTYCSFLVVICPSCIFDQLNSHLSFNRSDKQLLNQQTATLTNLQPSEPIVISRRISNRSCYRIFRLTIHAPRLL